MEAALNFHTQARGPELLLRHCALVGSLDVEREPPQTRLEQVLGADLARLLLRALAPQCRRGSSSP